MIHPGIDLGTTYSLIAHVNLHGQPALFPDLRDASEFRTPSVAYIGPEGCLVGMPAEQLLDDAPGLPVARFVKSRLGESDWSHADHLGREWSAESLSALVLRKLMLDADAFAGEPLGHTVLTVPARFTDEQRRATLQAAALAGLGSVSLLDEPVAAAVYHGLEQGAADRTLMVYDFGGGTFDVTVLQAGPEGLYVLATDGLARLGGRVLDDRIVDLATRALRERGGASALDEPSAAARLRRLAENAKIKLSRPGLAQVAQPLMLGTQPFEFVLTRGMFDAVAREAIDETVRCCERCLAAASLGWGDVDAIILVGGSSLLPHVPAALSRASGKPVRDMATRQPHQSVAFGAALMAQSRARNVEGGGSLVRPVSGADLCLRVWDRHSQKPGLEMLAARNTPLPSSYSRTFYTNREGQARLVLEFVQRRADDDEHSLGHFSFGPIPEARRNHPVEVSVTQSADGLVRVKARDLVSGREMDHTLEQPGRLLGGSHWEDQRRLVDSALINAI